MTDKYIKRISIFMFIFLLVMGCEDFFRRKIGGFAGSYPFVEYWDIKASEKEITEVIIELKKENSEFQPPNQSELVFKRDTGYIWTSFQMQSYLELLQWNSLTPLPAKTYDNYYHDYWQHINFYYNDTREIVHTWTRPNNDTSITTFAFVGLSNIDNYETDFRLINRDFWYIPNKYQIWKFKRTFVNNIQERIDKKRKAKHNTVYSK